MDASAEVRGALREPARLRGFDVVEASDMRQASQAVRNHRPDVVMLSMAVDGPGSFQALHAVREEDPGVLVVLLASHAERVEIEQGMNLGAVNFLSKPVDPAEAAHVLNDLYVAIEDECDIRQVLHLVVRRSTRLTFPGTPGHLSRIVAYLGREVRNNYPGLRVPVTEIKLALYEALANAIEHGNLEIDFDAKTAALARNEGFEPLLRERLQDPRLGRRRVHLEALYLPDRVVYKVRDEGAGFKPGEFEAKKALMDTSALHGRGLALIKHYMDEVEWNPAGNQIRMTRRILERRRNRRPGSATSASVTEGGSDRPPPAGTPPPRGS